MKVACASGAFARAIERGDMTQLEFIEMCARELACDGVVLDARHFPRTDGDYLAQIKKMAVDLGLDIAAVHDAAFFSTGDTEMRAALDLALAVGAPLLSAPLGLETASPWSAQLERLSIATGLAKAANVTLAIRNAPSTFAATLHDLKHASKEGDSAWLRYGIEPGRLDPADDPSLAAPKVVLVWADLAADPATVRRAFPSFLGYVALDDSGGAAEGPKMKARLASWRAGLS
jgi:sugar phosphate isomerase/epimerase